MGGSLLTAGVVTAAYVVSVLSRKLHGVRVVLRGEVRASYLTLNELLRRKPRQEDKEVA
jgi:hypothetical protein